MRQFLVFAALFAVTLSWPVKRSEGDFDHWFGAYNVGEDGKSLNKGLPKLTRSLADYLEERACNIVSRLFVESNSSACLYYRVIS